jgi:FkbM family methyltransferase
MKNESYCNIKIYYGIREAVFDVTNVCLSVLRTNNIITIPSGDNNRARIFTDAFNGIVKKIFIINNNVQTEYDDTTPIIIQIGLDQQCHIIYPNTLSNTINLHSRLQIKHGTFIQELSEQKIAVKYLTGQEKVLEIGGNIGRNSLIIASLLKSSKNLVVLESNAAIATQLAENRDLNHFEFYIEPSALSKRKLIQKDWNTLPSDVLLPGYEWVSTITWEDLRTKYNIEFDTLVLDCEGAFYYILMDMPEILDNIRLIIVENDYNDRSHKEYVDKVVVNNNFKRIYTEPLYQMENFYEVWKRE